MVSVKPNEAENMFPGLTLAGGGELKPVFPFPAGSPLNFRTSVLEKSGRKMGPLSERPLLWVTSCPRPTVKGGLECRKTHRCTPTRPRWLVRWLPLTLAPPLTCGAASACRISLMAFHPSMENGFLFSNKHLQAKILTPNSIA